MKLLDKSVLNGLIVINFLKRLVLGIQLVAVRTYVMVWGPLSPYRRGIGGTIGTLAIGMVVALILYGWVFGNNCLSPKPDTSHGEHGWTLVQNH